MSDNRIEIVVDTRASDADRQLDRLHQTIQSLKNTAASIRGTTFDAFSRAQIQPQIAALDELIAKINKTRVELHMLQQQQIVRINDPLGREGYERVATVVDFINQKTGVLDRSLISAASSARTLGTSLSAAAEADSRNRDNLDRVAGSANRAAMAYELMLSKSRAMATVQGTQFLSSSAMAGPARWIEEQRKYEKEVSQSFGAINAFIDSSSRKQQTAAREGYEAAAREVERTKQLRQREMEMQGDAAIRAAAARDEAARRVQSQEVYRSYATGEFLPGAVRSGPARFFSPDDIATAQSLTSRMDMFRHSNERVHKLLQLNRIGFLELQAAGVNTIQALASGMNVWHVAIMESAQVMGALTQGTNIMQLAWARVVAAVKSGAPIFTPIQLGIAGAATATVALATGMGMVAYRAYQAESAITGLHNRMLLQGRDAPQVTRNVDAMMNSMMARGGISRDDSRSGAIAIQSVPNISANARQSISESFEALSRTQFGGDFEKATEAVTKIFSSTSAMRGFIEENNLLTGELREQFEAAVAAGNGFRASELTAEALRESMSRTNEILKETRESFGWLATHDIFGRQVGPDPIGFDASLRDRLKTGGFEQLRFPGGREGPSPTEIGADRAVEQQLHTEREINSLILQRKDLTEAIRVTTDSTVRSTRSQAVQEIDRKLGEAVSPVSQEGHRLRIQILERELQQTELAAAKNPALWARAAELRKQIEDDVARHAQGALGRIEDATRRTTAEMIAAAQRTADARRRMAESVLSQQLFESNFRAAQSPTDVYKQLIEARTRLAAIEQAPADVGTAEQIQSIQLEILGLQRQIVDYEHQGNQARLQQAETIAQGRQDLAGIVSLRRQEAELIARNRFATDTQRTQAQTAIIQAQIQAQQRGVQLTQQATEAATQFANNRMQTSIAALNLEASQYNITREQAIQAEMKLTQSVMAQNQQRLRTLLTTQGLTVDQRAQINNQLADLYEQDAQKQLELQSRLTEAIRAENERRTQNFKNFFQTVENGLSDVLVAGVLKTQTRTEALRGLASSVVTSFIKEAANMGSQYAGKGLADALGIKVDPSGDTSISSVLAKGLGQALGLTKDVPKVDQAAIADKMKLASDTQKTAADLMLEAAKGMQQAAQSGPYRGGAGQAEVLKPGTKLEPITPYRPSVADSDFGATGEYGVGQPSASHRGRQPPPTASEQAMLAEIRRREGRKDDPYGTIHYPVDPSEAKALSLVEIQMTRVRKNSHAFGAYGFQPGTYRDMSKVTGIDPDDISPEAQDANALALLRKFGPNSSASWQASGPYPAMGSLKLDRADISQSVSSGVSQGNSALLSRQSELSSRIQSDATVTQQLMQTQQAGGQQIQQNTQTEDKNSIAVENLTAVMQQQRNGAGSNNVSPVMADNSDITAEDFSRGLGESTVKNTETPAKTAGISLNNLSSVVGLASGAIALFGGGMSEEGRKVVGAITLMISAMQLFSSMSSISGAGSAISGVGSVLKLIPFVGGLFERGGIVPSAAGGMVVGGAGGQLAIVHPREMVLPPRLSDGIQSMIERGSNITSDNRSNTINNSPVLNYSANVTGYHPYSSKSAFDGMLRKHGGAVLAHVENAIRNGWRG